MLNLITLRVVVDACTSILIRASSLGTSRVKRASQMEIVTHGGPPFVHNRGEDCATMHSDHTRPGATYVLL
jgi:hypothetical protein